MRSPQLQANRTRWRWMDECLGPCGLKLKKGDCSVEVKKVLSFILQWLSVFRFGNCAHQSYNTKIDTMWNWTCHMIGAIQPTTSQFRVFKMSNVNDFSLSSIFFQSDIQLAHFSKWHIKIEFLLLSFYFSWKKNEKYVKRIFNSNRLLLMFFSHQ